MKIKSVLLLLSMSFVLALIGCKTPTEDVSTVETPTENVPTVETPTVETPEPTKPAEGWYPETNLDDGKRKSPYALKVYSDGGNVIYFGNRFTGEGYTVKFLFEEFDNIGTNLPLYSAVTLTNFSFDDSKVDYRKEGTYVVKITGRVRSDVLTTNIIVKVKADKYEYLGVEHLLGLSSDEFVDFKVGGDVTQVIPSNLYAIYTENKYENEELVKNSKKVTEGYVLDTSCVDVTKAGQYPVYVSLSETYGDVTITVSTFFVLVVA